MAGYIGSKASVTVTSPETDSRYVNSSGDTITGDLTVTSDINVGQIKVDGTTVIDSSRNLSNVGGLKTVNGASIVGSGDISAGASTDYGSVGTYGFFLTKSFSTFEPGTTSSGSSLYVLSRNDGIGVSKGKYNTSEVTSAGRSGTWRRMAKQSGNSYSTSSNNTAGITLWVRIS